MRPVRPNSGDRPLVEFVVAVTRAGLLCDRVIHVGSAVLGWRVGRTFGKSEKCFVESESRYLRAFIAERSNLCWTIVGLSQEESPLNFTLKIHCVNLSHKMSLELVLLIKSL